MNNYIYQDVKYVYDCHSFPRRLYNYIFSPSFRMSVLFRKIQQLQNEHSVIRLRLWEAVYLLNSNKFLFSVEPTTTIGEGVIYPHNFPLVINKEAVIGKFVIIHPNVLVGRDRGKIGAPIIGDYCFIGNGAKIIGNCNIGSWTFVSPAAVITKDIPSNAIVGAGVNNIISTEKGAEHVKLYLPNSVVYGSQK